MFCASSKANNIVKGQPIEIKIFASNVPNKSLIFRIYKETMQLTKKKTNNTIERWAKNLNKLPISI